MPIIKMIFVLLLLIPVAILMLWLIARLRDEVPKQPDEDVRERKRRKKEKTSRKERRAARKQQENAVRSGDAERTADTAAGISGAEKNTPDGSGRSGSTASGAASNRQRGTVSGAASNRQRGTASRAASSRQRGTASSAASGRQRNAGHGAASGRNSADDGLRHPQELKRSERVPFEQSLPPARSNAASSAGRSETLQFPGREGGRTSADNAKKGTRSEKRPSKRQLRKNRERARKRDLKKQKRDS